MTDVPVFSFMQPDIDKALGQEVFGNFSDMGTGKTRWMVAVEKERDKTFNVGTNPLTLVVAPRATFGQWRDTFREFYPGRTPVIIDRKDRNGSFDWFKKRGDIWIMHWEGLRLMPELQQVPWTSIIADEVHKAQHRKSQQTQALKKIKARHKVGLSGTPTTGKPDKLWSPLNWLKPKDRNFSSYWRFYNTFVEYEIVYPQGYHKVLGPKNEALLQDLIEPFTCRHVKTDEYVRKELGLLGKYFSEVHVEMEDAKQRRAYQEMRKEMVAWVEDEMGREAPLVAPIAVARLMRLIQFASAYCMIDGDRVRMTEPSPKLDAVMEIIDDSETEQIVVFTHFKDLAYMLRARLDKAGITNGVYTGDQNDAERERVKDGFIKGDIRIFIGGIAAGGVGLDGLQHAASTAIFLDRDWSPANNNQAEDRVWRGGQQNAVQIIDIITDGTLDGGRRQQIQTTWQWIKQLLGS